MSKLEGYLNEIYRRLRTLETSPQTGLSRRASDHVDTSEGTASSTYVNLATIGPEVTVDIPSSGTALVIVRAFVTPGSSHGFMGVSIAGDNPFSPSDALAAIGGDGAFECSELYEGLAQGDNVFTAKYRSSGGTATFFHRSMTVIPI